MGLSGGSHLGTDRRVRSKSTSGKMWEKRRRRRGRCVLGRAMEWSLGRCGDILEEGTGSSSECPQLRGGSREEVPWGLWAQHAATAHPSDVIKDNHTEGKNAGPGPQGRPTHRRGQAPLWTPQLPAVTWNIHPPPGTRGTSIKHQDAWSSAVLPWTPGVKDPGLRMVLRMLSCDNSVTEHIPALALSSFPPLQKAFTPLDSPVLLPAWLLLRGLLAGLSSLSSLECHGALFWTSVLGMPSPQSPHQSPCL